MEKQRKSTNREQSGTLRKPTGSCTKNKTDQLLQSILNQDHTSVDELCDQITKIILEAAAESIPRGCRKHFKPFWSEDLQEAVSRRETARKELERDPTDENKIKYNKECAKVKMTVKQAKI